MPGFTNKVPNKTLSKIAPAINQPPQAQRQGMGSLGQRSPVQSMQNLFGQFQNQQAGRPQIQAPAQGMTGFGQAVQQNPQLQSQLGQLGSQVAGGMPLAPTTQQITSEEPRMQLMRSLQRFNIKGTG